MADPSDAPSSADPSSRDDRSAVGRDDERSEDPPRPAASPPSTSVPPLSTAPGGSSSTTYTLDRVVRFLIGAAMVGAVGWLLWYFAGLVLYLVVGGVLAYLLRPVVDWLQSMGLSRIAAILVTFVLVLGGVGVTLTSIVPFVGAQVRELTQLISVDMATDVARYLEDRVRQVTPIEEGVFVKNVERMAQALMQGDLVKGDQMAETVSSVVALFTNIVYAVVIIPFVTFFLLKDGLQIRRSLMRLVPNRYFEVTLAILDKVEGNIGRYFRALLVQCTSIAVIASALLWMVGLQNAIAIGIFTGLANTIPYFGPFLGFLCGTLVGIAQTGNLILVPWVALAMALTQLADNVLLQPLIFSRAAKAHPLVILFVVLIGARLGGIVGMLAAIPVTTTIRVVVEQILWSLRNYRILRSPS
jgi:predicted PurR-regulated permease PerM